MRSFSNPQSNERGSILIVTLLILAILTMVGISASTTTEIELQIAGNENFHKIAFYSAEAARGYVAGNPDLYGSANTTLGKKLSFPNTDPSQKHALSTGQSFNGDVEYMGSFTVPRGSGFDAGKFKGHRYKMACRGYGPSNARSEVEVIFYRIGF